MAIGAGAGSSANRSLKSSVAGAGSVLASGTGEGSSAIKSLKSSASGAGSSVGAAVTSGSSVRRSEMPVTAGASSTRRSPVSTLSAEISSSPDTISNELNRPLLSESISSISSSPSSVCAGISSLSSKL